MIAIGIELLRIELQPLNKAKLKSSDEDFINGILEVCCEACPKCRYEKECKKLYSKLIDVIPYRLPKSVTRKAKRDPGDWLQATLRSATVEDTIY